MTRRERAYNRRMAALVKKSGKLTEREVARVMDLLSDTRRDIAAIVAETDWQAHMLPERKAAVESTMEAFAARYRGTQNEALGNAWSAGIDLVDGPLASAGVRTSVTEIALTSLEIAQGFSIDLIKGLTSDAVKKVNTELISGVLGQKTPFEVMQAIGKALDDPGTVFRNIAHRAETITRTEMAKVNSMAREARLRAVADAGTEPAMAWKKRWLSSGRVNARETHEMLNDVEVPVDEDFPGGIPYPHAPGLPAAEVVNCGCTHVLASPDWDKLPKQFEAAPYQERAVYPS